LRLWRAFQKQIAACPEVTSWVTKIGKSNRPIFEALKKKGKVAFDRIGDTGMANIKVPPPKNMDEHLDEITKSDQETTSKRERKGPLSTPDIDI
ncbi:MAG: hypothetical protein II942_04965, partial [Alphaproteobacteria bacterium]|nr:hypothetical protein [Alphaproteobacteria bacterium]